jgi:hypothetical protein
MALDAAGMVMGWRFFDHAAHLSGILFGIFWCHLGRYLFLCRTSSVAEPVYFILGCHLGRYLFLCCTASIAEPVYFIVGCH